MHADNVAFPPLIGEYCALLTHYLAIALKILFSSFVDFSRHADAISPAPPKGYQIARMKGLRQVVDAREPAIRRPSIG
jgi:hypothetical protein